MPTTGLYKPINGKLRLLTPFMHDTRGWLHDTVGARGYTHRGGGSWDIAATHFHRKLINAIAHRFGQVVVKRETREGQDRCTTGCADANLDTADMCECVCLGDNHGQGAAGWKHVGERLLVRPGVLVLVTTIHRR